MKNGLKVLCLLISVAFGFHFGVEPLIHKMHGLLVQELVDSKILHRGIEIDKKGDIVLGAELTEPQLRQALALCLTQISDQQSRMSSAADALSSR